MDEAIDLVTKNQRYFPALLKGILLHYFISYIHPFFGGNGRTARTLFYFRSIKSNLKFIEMLSVSADFKNHVKQYERSFEKVVNNDLDITYFIDYNQRYSIESYAKSIDKSREIARQDLKRLTDLRFLEEIKEGKKFLYRIRKEKLESDLLQK